MCLFPQPNLNYKGIAYKKGIVSFECGACPECLQKRSRSWVARCFYEAKAHEEGACMITLTYDDWLRDEKGRLIKDRYGNYLEKPVVERPVIKRDVQLFMKRLRRYFEYHEGKHGIKFMACAEYGERTRRAHYHCILFGVRFKDRVFYKKSKRGHSIYMSPLLMKLWGHGIATIDSEMASAQVIRYCTKYTAKSRGGDTFMLASQRLGIPLMKKFFNGIGYTIEGVLYPVPKRVWNEIIMERYPERKMDFRYTVRGDKRNRALRKRFRKIRDEDSQYQNYLAYWSWKASQNPRNRLSLQQRISMLPDSKYFGYKQRAYCCMWLRMRGVECPSPGSNQKAYVEKWLWYQVKLPPRKRSPHFAEVYKYFAPDCMRELASVICPSPSRHIRTDDTNKAYKNPYCDLDLFAMDNGFKIFTSFSDKNIDKHPFV